MKRSRKPSLDDEFLSLWLAYDELMHLYHLQAKEILALRGEISDLHQSRLRRDNTKKHYTIPKAGNGDGP